MLLFLHKLFGDFRDALLVQRLRDQDDLTDAPAADRIVQRAGILDAQVREPASVLAEGVQQHGVIGHGQKLGGRVAARIAQHKTSAFHEPQLIPLHVTGRCHHVAVMVVHVLIDGIQHQVIFGAMFEQADFIELAFLLEVGNGFFQRYLLAHQRQVQIHQLAHALRKRIQVGLIQRRAAHHLAEVTAR